MKPIHILSIDKTKINFIRDDHNSLRFFENNNLKCEKCGKILHINLEYVFDRSDCEFKYVCFYCLGEIKNNNPQFIKTPNQQLSQEFFDSLIGMRVIQARKKVLAEGWNTIESFGESTSEILPNVVELNASIDNGKVISVRR